MKVKKRDGSVVRFSIRNINRAVLMAFNEVDPDNIPNVKKIGEAVKERFKDAKKNDIVEIDAIQAVVENVLMELGYHDAAREYIVYRHKREEIREQRLKPDPNALSEYIHMAKYARWLPLVRRRELYSETVTRVRDMHIRKFPELEAEIREAFTFVYDKKVLPSMRSMQFGGKAIEAHNARMYNCSFTLIDRPRVFQEVFYLLLAGCGCGFSVQWHHVDKLPAVKRIDMHDVEYFTIPDTIEGWADAIGKLAQAYFTTGKYIEFSYHQIRLEGEPLMTSGGKAPGHLGLKICLDNVRQVLDNAVGRQLRPIECHDICCHIAEAVLSGGIRRSSLISIFSPDDTEMMYAKVPGNFEFNGKNRQRAMANNSAALYRGKNGREIFERIIKLARMYGEPGFFFTNGSDFGCNPCGEIGLHPVDEDGRTGFGFCNLCEINMAAITSSKEYYEAARAAAIIGTLQASYTQFEYLCPASTNIAKRDALIGVGMTGIMDNPNIALRKSFQRKAAQVVLDANAEWAEKLGINQAKRCTTVKPSGTASLELGGVGSGIHPHHARRYFRRVTANPVEPPAQYFRQVNPHMVVVKPNGDWSIEFPTEAPDDARTVKNVSAREFMKIVFDTYENWVLPGTRDTELGLTHNVSCTVTFREGEYEDVIENVWKNRERIAAMSFAPFMLDKIYPFAPREEVTTDEDEVHWNYLISEYTPIDWNEFKEITDETQRRLEVACAGKAACDLAV